MVSAGLVHEHPRAHCQGTGAPPVIQLAFYCCEKDHDQQQLGDERVSFILQLTGHASSMRGVRAIEKCCLLPCSP